jgi:hypothetical protein
MLLACRTEQARKNEVKPGNLQQNLILPLLRAEIPRYLEHEMEAQFRSIDPIKNQREKCIDQPS